MLLNLIYLCAIVLASPVLLYRAVRQGKYRQGWKAKLTGRTGIAPTGKPHIWLHAVSVGEVNLLRQFVPQLRRQHPDHSLVVSTTTATGFELACRSFGPERVFYCPLDFTWAVRRTFAELQPNLLVLTELEVWPNLIREAQRHSTPVAVINGRLSESSHRGYRRIARLCRPTFSRLSLVACQDASYAQRFIDLGVAPEAVRISGSLKFDNSPSDRKTPEAMTCADLAGLRPWHQVWLAGSTQAGEEAIVLKTYNQLRTSFPNLRLILVPRHPERFDACAAEIQAAGLECIRRTSVVENFADDPLSSGSVFLVDTIGELRDWWATAQIAFVGGSLGNRGGQNMLEPAGYGAAVCFGPNTRNFREIVTHLLNADAAVVVANEQELRNFVSHCCSEPIAAQRLGLAATAVVKQHRGASDITLRLLRPLVQKTTQQRVA